jgi:hypothetical protein
VTDVSDNSEVGGPIFILGAMGSGTTLLRLMLDSHPRIAIPQETGFARAMMAQRYVPFWLFGDQWYGRLGYDEEAFRQHLRGFYETMFQHYAAQHGKVRWGEKTPFHVWHADQITEVFPDAVFVAIVRHSGGNVGSLQGRFKFSARHGIEHWSTTNRQLLAVAEDHPDRTVFCRYEDLVLQSEQTMRELLAWLDEPWSQQVLEHHVVHSERGTPQQVEGRTRSDHPIDTERVSKWTAAMDERGMDLLRQRTPRIAEFFGYAVDEPVPTRPLAGEGRVLMTAPEAVARLGEFRRKYKVFGSRPTPRLRDQPLDPRVMGPSESQARGKKGQGGKARKRRKGRTGAAKVRPQAQPVTTGRARQAVGGVKRVVKGVLSGARR